MSDFFGMSGALIVCLIAQAIVFIALGIMAGVIYLVGKLAGSVGEPGAVPLPQFQTQAGQGSDEGEEIAAAVMGALTAELDRGDSLTQTEQKSSWRLVALQEAAKGITRK